MSPPAAGGRPRDPSIDAAVLTATVELLHESGWAGFALEKAAARAGTSKAAIRRRWPRRQRLVIDALATLLVAPAPPDNGCTRCDLHQTVQLLAGAVHEKLPPGVLAPLAAECANDPELQDHLHNALVCPSRSAALSVVRRAAERGDLRAETDPELLVDLLASTVYRRALLGEPALEASAARELVDMLLRGAAVDFDHLVSISRLPAEHRHRFRTGTGAGG